MNEASTVVSSRRHEGDERISDSSNSTAKDGICVNGTASPPGGRPTSPTEAFKEPNAVKSKVRRGTAPSVATFTRRGISRGVSQPCRYAAEASSPTDGGRRTSLQQWLSSAVKAKKKEDWGILVPVDSMLSPIGQQRNQPRSSTGPHKGFADDDTGFKLTPAILPADAIRQAGQTVNDGVGGGEQCATARALRENCETTRQIGLLDEDEEEEKKRGKDGDNLSTSEKHAVQRPQSPTSTIDDGSSSRKDMPPPRPQQKEATKTTTTIEEETNEYHINAIPNRDHHVRFLSATMGLTVDIGDDCQPAEDEDGETGMYDHLPASPCSGVISHCSPRYGTLQIFRKHMASRGIDAQVRKKQNLRRWCV